MVVERFHTMGEHSGKFLRVVGVQTEGKIDLFSTVVTGSVLRTLNNCVWLLMYSLCFQERLQCSNQHEDVSAIVILVPNSSVFFLWEEVFVTWKQPSSSDPTGHVAVFPPTALAGQVSDTHVLKMEGVVCGVTFGCVVVCHTHHVVELCLSRVSDRMHGRKQGRKKPFMRARECSWNQREVFFFLHPLKDHRAADE